MSKAIGSQTNFSAGISFSEKEGPQNSVAFLRAVNHRSDPKSVVLNPRAELDSGSIVTDLPLWGSRACSRTFVYGNSGNIYQNENDAWTLVNTAANSHGNGMEYFEADRALYYAQDTTFGRLLDACTGETFYDDFLGSEGGEPTNTKSIDFERSSSMYLSRADTASTSITADLSIEAYLKPESLPASNEIYTIVSKWDEQSNKRSYKFDITTSSNFFGDGRDGALTISSPTTEDPIDANCTGTAGQYTLTITNAHASFASVAQGDKLVIHQTRGTDANTRQFATVQSYSGGVLTLQEPLTFSPQHSATASVANKAQVRVLKQYTTVTINAAYSCKAWDGLKGGIMGGVGNTSLTGTGSINLVSKGFRGGIGYNLGAASGLGEGTGGASTTFGVQTSGVNNGNGGGSSKGQHSSGGGGGNATTGSNGNRNTGGSSDFTGQGGAIAGASNLSSIALGGGAAGTSGSAESTPGSNGGGISFWFFPTINLSQMSSVSSNSGIGGNHTTASGSGGSTGAGGSQHYKCQTINFGSGVVTSVAGTPGTKSGYGVNGVRGGEGRIHVDYLTSVTGTTSPNYSSAQDPTLGSADGYVLRLLISSNGTNSETYSQVITDSLEVGNWARWAVTWENTTSTANFYRNGVLLGTKTGSFTSINDNASRFAIAADFDSSGNPRNYFDGLMDDARVWNDVRTQSELATNNDQKLFGTEANLIAYYEFESNTDDSQADGLNDLTAFNTPTYSSDVPFSGISTRNDQDQGLTSGSFVQGYTLATAINEGATHRQTFSPTKDPQKSIIIDIDTVGTGNWTLTVHDQLNRVVATKTLASSELYTGFYEFTFDEVWRPIIGATYHFHLTSTVADGIVDTTGANDLETAYFTTHYQFLVEDPYHPMKQMLDFMVIGNERYLAKFQSGDVLEPHRLTFPSGYRVRCLAYWREYLVIGCWKGEEITDYDDGRIFFWDGVKDTYNYSIPVPEGGVNAMFGTQDVLFIVAGYTGEILIYSGEGSASKFNKIPKLAIGEYVEVAPGSMNMWRSNIHMGVNLNTDSETVHKGVYSIGSANAAYSPSLGFDYPTSLGDQVSSMVKVGMVFPSGQGLYIGWQNGNSYGIDKVLPTNPVFSSGTVETLISDLGEISKEKYPLVIRADFKPLETGQSIRLKYKPDRADLWKEGGAEDTVFAEEAKLIVSERCKEIQVGVDLFSTVDESPTLLGLTIVSEMEESSGQNR